MLQHWHLPHQHRPHSENCFRIALPHPVHDRMVMVPQSQLMIVKKHIEHEALAHGAVNPLQG